MHVLTAQQQPAGAYRVRRMVTRVTENIATTVDERDGWATDCVAGVDTSRLNKDMYAWGQDTLVADVQSR
jgi:hypothetical protein